MKLTRYPKDAPPDWADDDVMGSALTRYVTEGMPLFRPGDLRVTITIDIDVMRRAAMAVESARSAMAGMASPMLPWQRVPDDRIIDQED